MPAGRGLGAALGHPAQGRLLTAQHKWNTHVPYKVAVRHLQRSLKREQPARKGRLITVSRFTPSLGILSVHKGSWEEMRTCLPHHQPTTSSPTPKDTNLTSHPLLTRHLYSKSHEKGEELHDHKPPFAPPKLRKTSRQYYHMLSPLVSTLSKGQKGNYWLSNECSFRFMVKNDYHQGHNTTTRYAQNA